MKGYTNRVLFVNLSDGSLKEEEIGEELYRQFLGGVGIGAKTLYDRMKPKVDPLGPENLLGFMTGPLTGTSFPGTARYVVMAKSPLTGTWGEANSGGYFGTELKAAGYDGVFFSGVSPEPVYLWLSDSEAQLREARHLWGRDTAETEDILHQELGDNGVRIACIGPFGESRSLIAAIINDKGRAAARSGLGAVMGAKRLKAIAVRGRNKVQVADVTQLNALRANFNRDIPESKGYLVSALRKHGTCGIFSPLIEAGTAPVKNWALFGDEAFPAHSKLHGVSVTKYQVRKFACSHCSIACGGIVKVDEGPFSVGYSHKPEYETLASFGSNCLNDNVESIIIANDICNRYGIDTISAGATIAFAIECYERGVIGKSETGGIELTWGNAAAILAMLEKMARREGLGAVFADGSKKAAERIGVNSEQWAIHVHGQELGNVGASGRPVQGVGYIADPTPGRHTVATLSSILERGASLGPYSELQTPKIGIFDCRNKDKGTIYAVGSSYNLALNASGACIFVGASGFFPLPELISAVTGWNLTMAELITIGRRIQTLRQLFNVREGLCPGDFYLPKRITDPAPTGPFAGRTVDYDALRRSYYEAMGWDAETGIPSQNTLNDLNIACDD